VTVQLEEGINSWQHTDALVGTQVLAARQEYNHLQNPVVAE